MISTSADQQPRAPAHSLDSRAVHFGGRFVAQPSRQGPAARRRSAARRPRPLAQPSPAASAAAALIAAIAIVAFAVARPARRSAARRAANGSARRRPSRRSSRASSTGFDAIDGDGRDLLPRAVGLAPVLAAQMQQLQVRLDRAEQPVDPGVAGRWRCRNPRRAPPRPSPRRPHRPAARATAPVRSPPRRTALALVSSSPSKPPASGASHATGSTANSGIATASSPRSRARSHGRACARLGAQDQHAPHCGGEQPPDRFRRLGQQRRARAPSAVVESPQSNTARSSTISLPSSLNSCARIRRSPSSSTQKAATGDAQVAPSARVNARSAITQSISDLVVDRASARFASACRWCGTPCRSPPGRARAA